MFVPVFIHASTPVTHKIEAGMRYSQLAKLFANLVSGLQNQVHITGRNLNPRTSAVEPHPED